MLSPVRTTVTLDADTESLIRQRMKARRQSFKQVVNDAIRAGLVLPTAGRQEFRTEVASLGVPTVNLDRALQLVGELEDDELIRRLRQRS
jgi:hypothetical protein